VIDVDCVVETEVDIDVVAEELCDVVAVVESDDVTVDD
jgi:hypothetical protein